MKYEPDEGDVVWTDFDPGRGREQMGRRPAVVLSPSAFYRASQFAIVCPITSKVRPFASSVVLPDGFAIKGEILVSHIRSIDTVNRPVRYAGTRVPPAILAAVRANAAILIGLRETA